MFNSPFTRHGIRHLSASSLNLWQDNPGLWALRYLAGLKEDTNAAQARGNAVEGAMLYMLHGKPQEAALETALNNFTENMAGEINEEIDAERALITPMVDQLYKWNRGHKILGSQVKIEHWFDGVSVPLIGYIDFHFEDAPLLDLKTTKRMPSEPRPEHARQVSLYRLARNQTGALLYVSDKKHAYFEIDDETRDEAINQLHSAALSLERFLARFDVAEDAIRCLPQNPDSFKFSDAAKLKVLELRL